MSCPERGRGWQAAAPSEALGEVDHHVQLQSLDLSHRFIPMPPKTLTIKHHHVYEAASGARSEARVGTTVMPTQTVAVAIQEALGAVFPLVERSRTGFNLSGLQSVEKRAAIKASILTAAVAGKIIKQEIVAEETVEALRVLAASTEVTTAAFVTKVKELLRIQDLPGVMAELYPAGEGVEENDRMSYRAILSANPLERVELFWISTPQNVKKDEALAREIISREIVWAKAQGLSFEGRFQIYVTTSFKTNATIANVASQTDQSFKAMNVRVADATATMVLAGTADLLDQIGKKAVRAKLVERKDYTEDPNLRGAAHLAMAVLSQEALLNADLLSARTEQILNSKINDRYSLNETGLMALVAQLTSAIQAMQMMARAA